jgi:hypothetical protein
VPKLLVWDGEGAVGRYRPKDSLLTQDCQAFRGVLGVRVYVCKPADPEAKGMLERFHDYLESSFLPGREQRNGGYGGPISCVESTFCVATGWGYVVTFDGVSWSEPQQVLPDGAFAVWRVYRRRSAWD